MKEFVDARVTIDDPAFGIGDIVLAPRLLCGIVGPDSTVFSTLTDSGFYDFRRRGDTLVFNVHAGGAHVQWTDISRRCRLHIVAVSVRGAVCGTKFVVAVDTSRTVGFVYVVEDSVRFLDWPGLTAQAGQLFEVRAGSRPTLASAAQTAEWIDPVKVRYHAEGIWQPSRPSWLRRLARNPWTYVGGAALGVGVWMLTRDGDTKQTTTTIVVPIPL